jgi:hypothetical protein
MGIILKALTINHQHPNSNAPRLSEESRHDEPIEKFLRTGRIDQIHKDLSHLCTGLSTEIVDKNNCVQMIRRDSEPWFIRTLCDFSTGVGK